VERKNSRFQGSGDAQFLPDGEDNGGVQSLPAAEGDVDVKHCLFILSQTSWRVVSGRMFLCSARNWVYLGTLCNLLCLLHQN